MISEYFNVSIETYILLMFISKGFTPVFINSIVDRNVILNISESFNSNDSYIGLEGEDYESN